ncbi:MAG: SoxR reducing system RseC family protein [Bacteroidaceae bacterium]|nr:SoxR reducing system RseC family protein [Bacteroidaceae bacterium]
MAFERIGHKGDIVAVDGNSVHIMIRQETACGACSVRRLCPSSESKEKIVEVEDGNAAMYHVGQEVYVYGIVGMGRKAVIMAFGLPLLLALIWIPLAIVALHLHDVTAVLLLLMIYGVYFTALHLLRDKFSRTFIFKIENT